MQYTGQIVVQLYIYYRVPRFDILQYWNESSKLWGLAEEVATNFAFNAVLPSTLRRYRYVPTYIKHH